MAELQLLLAPSGGGGATFTFGWPEGAEKYGTSAFFLDNDFAIPLQQTVVWGYHSGVTPQAIRLVMMQDYADKFISQHGPEVSIHMLAPAADSPNRERKTRKFEKLRLLQRDPHDHISHGVFLADDRWNWPRAKVTKAYNLTLKQDDVAVFARGSGADVDVLAESRRYYRENTLNPKPLKPAPDGGPLPWSALDIVVDVLLDDLGYREADIDLGKLPEQRRQYIPPNIVIEGEPATAVLQRFLALDGFNLYIDEKGRIVLFDQLAPFGEKELRKFFKNGMPPKIGGDLWVVDLEAQRPSEVEIQSVPEKEVLFTFTEGGRTAADGPAGSVEEARRQLSAGRVFVENVTRTLYRGQVGELPAGTLVRLEDALNAYAAQFDLVGPNGERVGLEHLRRSAGNAQWMTLFATSAGSIEFFMDERATRIGTALARDYRSLFRIPKHVMEELLGISPTLAIVLNEQSGAREPSTVFSKVTWFPDLHYRIRAESLWMGSEADSFSRDEVDQKGVPTGNRVGKNPYDPIPATVAFEDLELGLYRVNFLTDMKAPGAFSVVLPGVPENKDLFFDGARQGIGRQGSAELLISCPIEEDWECSVVMTVTRLGPNNRGRLYRQRFKPKGEQQGKGTLVTQLQNLDTARFTLPDFLQAYRTTDISFIAFVNEHPEVEATAQEFNTNVDLGEETTFTNRALIKAIGEAEAARIYRTWVNQADGAVTLLWTSQAAELRPQASLTDVRFSFTPDGLVSVHLRAQRVPQAVNILNFLPERVLRRITRQIPFEGARRA